MSTGSESFINGENQAQGELRRSDAFVAHSSLGDGLGLEADYIINGFLEAGEQALIYGQPKVGKTFLAIQLAVEVATGGKFLCWKVPKERKVLYINFEMGHRVFASRVTSHLKTPPLDTPTENVASHFDRQLGGRLVFTTHPRSIDVLASTKILDSLIQSHKPELVIFDTLSKTHGVDERANEKIGAVLTAIRVACQVDGKPLAHIIVHHARKAAISMDDSAGSYVSASEIRGGSSIRGEADVIAGLYSRAGGKGGGQSRCLILEARNVNLPDMDIVFTSDLRFEMAEAQSRDQAKDLLINKLREAKEPLAKKELFEKIARELDLEVDTVRKSMTDWIKWAAQRGIIADVALKKTKALGADGRRKFLIVHKPESLANSDASEAGAPEFGG